MFWYTAKNNKNHVSVQKNHNETKKMDLPVSTVIPKWSFVLKVCMSVKWVWPQIHASVF